MYLAELRLLWCVHVPPFLAGGFSMGQDPGHRNDPLLDDKIFCPVRSSRTNVLYGTSPYFYFKLTSEL
jgi:hypothetical protein